MRVIPNLEKNALITGGNSGIGFATAKLLKENGYKVFISGRNAESIRTAAEELSASPIFCDVRKLDDIIKTASQFNEAGLDVLVNNAGIAIPKPVTDISLKDFSDSFHTNVRGPLFMIKELVPALSRCKGCIINVSSVITRKSSANTSIYAATKGSVDAFTKSLALELASRNIRVNAVSPGFIDTSIFTKRGLVQEELDRMKQKRLSNIPMNRFGKSEEVAHVILSLIESSYVTGSVWEVDGGFSAG
ncbi:MAG: SDR family oxidoreductase [Proteobacteria bacterium]|nr:SDR family oxidoreductase [Pseudomonadota bacterium]